MRLHRSRLSRNVVMLGFILVIFASVPLFSYATSHTDPQTLLNSIAGKVFPGSQSRTLKSVIITIIESLLGLVGTIFLILMIYGGVLWMTSAGSTEQVQKAQNIFKNAAIGIIIIALSAVISRFVLAKLGAL